MAFIEILNSIRDRIIEIDDDLHALSLNDELTGKELLKELNKLNNMLATAKGV